MRDNNGCVYVVYSFITNLYKIGMCFNHERKLKRFKEIEKDLGHDIYHVISICLEIDHLSADKLEKILHDKYSDKRKYREWFSLSYDDLLAIRDLINDVRGEWVYDSFDHIKDYIDNNEHKSLKSLKINNDGVCLYNKHRRWGDDLMIEYGVYEFEYI